MTNIFSNKDYFVTYIYIKMVFCVICNQEFNIFLVGNTLYQSYCRKCASNIKTCDYCGRTKTCEVNTNHFTRLCKIVCYDCKKKEVKVIDVDNENFFIFQLEEMDEFVRRKKILKIV